MIDIPKYTPEEVGAIVRGTQPDKPKRPKKPEPPMGFYEIFEPAVLMFALLAGLCLILGAIF